MKFLPIPITNTYTPNCHDYFIEVEFFTEESKAFIHMYNMHCCVNIFLTWLLYHNCDKEVM